MGWFSKKPKGSGDPVLDMRFDRATALIKQSFDIPLPKNLSIEEQRVRRANWVRAQVAEDARAYAAAGGAPNVSHARAVQGMIDAAFLQPFRPWENLPDHKFPQALAAQKALNVAPATTPRKQLAPAPTSAPKIAVEDIKRPVRRFHKMFPW